MRLISRSAIHVSALISGVIILCYRGATLAAEIPWKIDEPTAQRLAAEAVYGADKYLEAFDYADKLNHPFFEYYGINDPPAKAASATLPSIHGPATCGRCGDAAECRPPRCANRRRRSDTASPPGR